ncbi:hypothetical protein Q2404_24390, partial [Escherichia coli]|nr:hypothetical protein [Escherichia coli]
IGGYTTPFVMKRSKKVLLRWGGFRALTPMMRTPEGKPPGDNRAVDRGAEKIAPFSPMTSPFTTPKPFLKAVSYKHIPAHETS